MEKLWATFRTVGVLLGLWVILGVAGLVAGVIPLDALRGAAASSDPAPPDARAPDAGPLALDGGAAPSGDDASVAAAEPEPARSPDAAPEPDDTDTLAANALPAGTTSIRHAVCDAPGGAPSLAVGQLFGDERPEIVVGCADGWHVVGLGPSGPARVAVFSTRAAPRDQRSRLGEAAFGDIDGDGAIDAVLPLAFETASGASRGGGLFWVPGSPFGGVREPVVLAPIAAVAARVGPLDDAVGADLVAMNRTNALAQLPSEVWRFTGGAAPTRAAALVTGLDGRDVQLADIDRDGRTDAVSLSRDRVELHFGGAADAPPRSHVFEMPGAREIALGDLDADGGVDLAVLSATGLVWIRGGSLSGMEPRGIDGVPATMRELAIRDVDGDERLDFVAWDHPRLVVLHHRGELDFLPRTGATLAGGPFGPRRHRVADLDADGFADDVVILGGVAGESAPLEILMAIDALSLADAPSEGRTIAPSEQAAPLPDAPLVLRAPLAP